LQSCFFSHCLVRAKVPRFCFSLPPYGHRAETWPAIKFDPAPRIPASLAGKRSVEGEGTLATLS